MHQWERYLFSITIPTTAQLQALLASAERRDSLKIGQQVLITWNKNKSTAFKPSGMQSYHPTSPVTSPQKTFVPLPWPNGKSAKPRATSDNAIFNSRSQPGKSIAFLSLPTAIPPPSINTPLPPDAILRIHRDVAESSQRLKWHVV